MAHAATVNPSAARPRRRRRRHHNPSNPPRRRRRARRHNPIHPVLAGSLGALGGILVGAGASVGLRYTSLSPMARGGILAGVGLLAAVGGSFVSPALGAGLGAGIGAGGGTDLILELTAPKASPATSEEVAGIREVRAELGEVRVALGRMMGGGRANLLEARRMAPPRVEVSSTELLDRFGR